MVCPVCGDEYFSLMVLQDRIYYPPLWVHQCPRIGETVFTDWQIITIGAPPKRLKVRWVNGSDSPGDNEGSREDSLGDAGEGSVGFDAVWEGVDGTPGNALVIELRPHGYSPVRWAHHQRRRLELAWSKLFDLWDRVYPHLRRKRRWPSYLSGPVELPLLTSDDDS